MSKKHHYSENHKTGGNAMQKQPQPQNVTIDTREVPNVRCNGVDTETGGECGCEIFVEFSYIKILSALMSPTGKEAVINVQNWMCDECGKPLDHVIADRKKDEETKTNA
jgi:hypothetical protein